MNNSEFICMSPANILVGTEVEEEVNLSNGVAQLRRWRVYGKHWRWVAWILISGSTRRLVFPDEMHNYFILE